MIMMSCTIVMMDDGIYKENDNHDNDDNDNEEQMLMQTPHYPPAETYCCWDVMVISRCPQTIVTVTTFLSLFPSFLVDISMSPNYVSRNNFLLLFPLILGDLLMSPNEYYRNNFFIAFPSFLVFSWCRYQYFLSLETSTDFHKKIFQ